MFCFPADATDIEKGQHFAVLAQMIQRDRPKPPI